MLCNASVYGATRESYSDNESLAVKLCLRNVLSRYTRNGKLLGDGFVPVYESNLVPVVGFHSNGESVRVNFGVVPFAYEVNTETGSRNIGCRHSIPSSRWPECSG